MLYLKNPKRIKHALTVPVISSCIVPLVILDIWIEIYHRTCFPLCGLPYIERGKYIKIDRHKLEYLNLAQKIYCVYCGYGNGAIHYWSEIAGATEHYWCGIKHKENNKFIPPRHHKDFSKYDDKEDFQGKYKK